MDLSSSSSISKTVRVNSTFSHMFKEFSISFLTELRLEDFSHVALYLFAFKLFGDLWNGPLNETF